MPSFQRKSATRAIIAGRDVGKRLTKIYTRTGDAGQTGLTGGERVDKDSHRIEAIGDVDELNCAIGLVLAHDAPPEVRVSLTQVQHDLFNLGGELSMRDCTLISQADVERLERTLDKFNAALPALREFILPGGGAAAASCHLARAICRRAERRVIALARNEPVNMPTRIYLNRLSDLLFVLCRVLTLAAGEREVYWQSRRSSEDQ
jgi:cob(I)alamin adenosyltransferase